MALPPLRPAAFFWAVVPPWEGSPPDPDFCPPCDDASGEFAILAARSLDMPLSLRASYCFWFLTAIVLSFRSIWRSDTLNRGSRHAGLVRTPSALRSIVASGRCRAALLLVPAALAGCSSHAAAAPVSCAGPISPAASAAAPSQAAAASTAAAYLRSLGEHHPRLSLERPATAAARCSIDHLRSWLGGIPIQHLQVIAEPIGSLDAHSVAVLATLSARLGNSPGTTSISLGQRELAISRGTHPVVTDDISVEKAVASDGLASIPKATYAVGRSGVIASDGAPAADVRLALNAMEDSYPALTHRYGSSNLPSPLVMLVPDWHTAELVEGVPVARRDAGVETNGLVVLVEGSWCCGIAKSGIVVHELTHAAARAMLRVAPRSLVEGVARYQEQQWDAAHGYTWRLDGLAAAYRRGWSDSTPWQSGLGLWYDVSPSELALRYNDGATVVRAIIAHSGVAGLKRFAASLGRGDSGYFSPARLNAAAKSATGETFAALVYRAQLMTP